MNPLNFPHLDSYINDFSSIFNDEEKNSLNSVFRDHETQTTEQVVTILFPHRQGNELLNIGLKVFNENGIGQKNLNNGLLLIVATEEKKIRIIVGKGLELKYTEMRCRDIIENHLRPLLNEGKYEEMLRVWNTILQGDSLESIGSQEVKSPRIEDFDDFVLSRKIIKVISILFIIIALISSALAVFGMINRYGNSNFSGGSSNSESSSDWGSSSDSSSDWGGSSSFDGGGGSSNGGGWGD